MTDMKTPEEYLLASLKRLSSWIPGTPEGMYEEYMKGSLYHTAEKDGKGRTFLLFAWEESARAERLVTLVYDEADRIIADCSAVSCSFDDLMKDPEIYDLCSEESDWMYLEHYIACRWSFPDLPYPYCEEERKEKTFGGEALLFSNAYVTESFRRQGIFRMMETMMHEAVMRSVRGSQDLCAVFSMDPDVACYGPDAKDEPYYYSYEKDEPARLRNAAIALRLGYEAVKLTEDDPKPDSDGTKIWFCIKREKDLIIESDLAGS